MGVFAAIRKGMTRWQAFAAHLSISIVVAATVLAVMLFAWYPPPLFEAEGGRGLALILIGVDVVIGPLLTLVVFKSGKPGLRFDLCTIAALQVSALIYGCHVIAEARPAFIVFVKDQFEIVSAVELAPADLKQARRAEFRQVPLTGPVVVAAEPPADRKEMQALLFLALEQGRDMRHFPQYYVPYDEYRQQALARARPLEKIRGNEPEIDRIIGKYLVESGRDGADLRYLPLRATRGWGAALIDARSGSLVKMLLVPGE